MPPIRHVIQQGECASSVAHQHGFVIETIWDDGANADLRAQRESPYVLLPGDVLVIPQKRQKTVTCETGRRHTFRRKGVPETLRVQLLCEGKPRPDLPWVLEVGSTRREGTTDAEGWIETWVPPDAKSGNLTLPEDESYEVQLGGLDPVDEESGARARLENLGLLPSGEAESEEDRELLFALALILFQAEADSGLEITGKIDEATIARLKERYGA